MNILSRGVRAGLFIVHFQKGRRSVQTATLNLVLVVTPAQLAVPPVVLPAAVQGQTYVLQMPPPTGGTPPYHWSATGLPEALTMSPTGLISGTPATSGTFPVAATVTDSGT